MQTRTRDDFVTPACPKHTSIEVLANYSSLSSASPIKISATELRGIRIDQLLCLKDWLKQVGIIVNLRKNTHKSLELAIWVFPKIMVPPNHPF